MDRDDILPAWIIEELRRRREELDERARIPAELPLPLPVPPPARERAEEEPRPSPGCVVIDLWS